MDAIKALGLDSFAQIIGTVAAALILGAVTWMTQVYRRFCGIERNTLAIAQAATRAEARIARHAKKLVEHTDELDDHEGRITDLEREE